MGKDPGSDMPMGRESSQLAVMKTPFTPSFWIIFFQSLCQAEAVQWNSFHQVVAEMYLSTVTYSD